MADHEIPFEELEIYLRKPSEARRSSESLEMSDNLITKSIQRNVIVEDLAKPFFKTHYEKLNPNDSVDFDKKKFYDEIFEKK